MGSPQNMPPGWNLRSSSGRRWAPNQDPSSPKAAVAEMEEEMRTMNAEREAGKEVDMRRMGVPAARGSLF